MALTYVWTPESVESPAGAGDDRPAKAAGRSVGAMSRASPLPTTWAAAGEEPSAISRDTTVDPATFGGVQARVTGRDSGALRNAGGGRVGGHDGAAVLGRVRGDARGDLSEVGYVHRGLDDERTVVVGQDGAGVRAAGVEGHGVLPGVAKWWVARPAGPTHCPSGADVSDGRHQARSVAHQRIVGDRVSHEHVALNAYGLDDEGAVNWNSCVDRTPLSVNQQEEA